MIYLNAAGKSHLYDPAEVILYAAYSLFFQREGMKQWTKAPIFDQKKQCTLLSANKSIFFQRDSLVMDAISCTVG